MINLKHKFSYHVARCYNKPDALSKEMRIFVDASKKAYGAIAYISQDGKLSLIISYLRLVLPPSKN